MNTTANMGSARKRAAHPHRLCRTLLNVGEANKHIPEDGALADDVDLDAIRPAGVDACQKRTLIWQAVWPRRQRLAFLGQDRPAARAVRRARDGEQRATTG